MVEPHPRPLEPRPSPLDVDLLPKIVPAIDSKTAKSGKGTPKWVFWGTHFKVGYPVPQKWGTPTPSNKSKMADTSSQISRDPPQTSRYPPQTSRSKRLYQKTIC